MGRPRKEIDKGVMFHMLMNNAPVTHIARHLGIHRDTLYTKLCRRYQRGQGGTYGSLAGSCHPLDRGDHQEKKREARG